MHVNWITLLIWLLFGCATAHFAKHRGRNPYPWFFIGLFLGVIGLGLVFLFPKKNIVIQKASEPETIDLPPELPEIHKNKFWYYLDPANTQVGPMSFDALVRDWRNGIVQPQTHVWNENLVNWTPFSEFLKKPTSS
ncbi:MAG TPA: DUF4339 domain-containing protein [Rhabdochlamydiaceae bacterium]|nr:DUF4339 domain-containing protein [Rhabdochlamydiaceae bacterium]